MVGPLTYNHWMLGWWNLLFLVPFGVGLIYLVVYSLTGISFGEELSAEADHDVDADHDIDADHDVDADADADHDIDADHDADTDHDGDTDHEADGDHESDHQAHAQPHAAVDHVHEHAAVQRDRHLLSALTWLGLGRAPLSLLLMVFCFSWGFVGFAMNNMLVSEPLAGELFAKNPDYAPFVSLPVTLILSLFLTRGTARVMGKWIPSTETSVRRQREFVGASAEALFPIDTKFGQASLRDHEGNLHQINCRTYPDAKPLAKGTRVLTVDYNEQDRFYWVIESDLQNGNI